jgi:vitamin B12 transporter
MVLLFQEAHCSLKKNKTMSKKMFTLSVCLIATSLVFGQQKDKSQKDSALQNSTSNKLEDVIVTANKIEQKQSGTSKVITVITPAQIQQNAGRTIAQILNEQAGLSLPGTLSNLGTVPSIYMRGAASGRTLILIDGAPVGDPSMISNEFDLNLVPLNQVERIEILKGAQSTLYGSDAIGGVINIITKGKGSPFVTGSLSYGSYGTKQGNLQFNSNINKLNYTIGFENQNADGFSSAKDLSNKANFDQDGYQNNSFFVKAKYKFDTLWNLQLSSRKTAYKSAIDYGGFKDDKDNEFKNATTISGLILQYKKAKTSFQFQYQYTTQDRTYFNDSADKQYLVYENNQYAGKTHFADAYLSKPIGQNIQWIIGADFRYGSYNQTYESISQWGPYNDAFKDTFQYQNAIYTSVLINDNAKKWLLELGARYNNHNRFGSNQTFTINPSYALSDQIRLIASISNGFKAPSLYQLGYNDQLKAETSFNTELGVSFRKGQVFARAVYFNRNIKNGIDYNYIDYNFFNFIQQKVNGLEIEIQHPINEQHQFSLNYTLMNGQETNQNRITTTDTITYNYLLKRPKHSVNAQWNYTINKKWSSSVTGRFISERKDVGGYASPDITLGYYTLLNASVQYKLGSRIVVFANAQNLLNDQFSEIYGYNAIGRMFHFGIRLN